jgi:NADPH:quinone reductase
MRAAYDTKLSSASDVLRIGEIDTPSPGPGEIRVRVHVSGVNPSDWKGACAVERMSVRTS